MKTPDLKDAIDKVIGRSFNAITDLYNKKNDHTRLKFPQYTHGSQKGKPRVSEQEFRQLFVEEFNIITNELCIDWYYSIETPTKKKYRFSGEDNPGESEYGVSGRFDLTIWLNDKMVAVIEFKAGNASPQNYEKDICKLVNPDEGEKDTLRYFVNILEDSNQITIDSLDKKLTVCMNKIGEKLKVRKKDKKTIHYWFLSMGVHRQRNKYSKEFIY